MFVQSIKVGIHLSFGISISQFSLGHESAEGAPRRFVDEAVSTGGLSSSEHQEEVERTT